jgi:signal transduction histidine kinase/CheY-like chemotaxis protein
MLVDDEAQLWLGTGNGLSRFDPATGTFQNFDIDDGLQSNEFSAGAAWQAPDGQMFFGGTNGLTAFYPDQIGANPYQPPVILTNVQLFNKPLPVAEDSPLAQAINFTDHLTFNHDQDIISFEFAALSYAAPHKNRYRYKLDGFEADWNDVSSERRFASYTNLPPGDYTLRVQGSNDSGLWSEQEATLTLAILPPWWETTWFRLLALAGLLGLVYGGYRWRVIALKQRSQQLETEVAARTYDLQESEERFATVMNSFEAVVYVADMETYELLFINEYTRRMFGDVEDKLCWQVLQAGQTGPCEFCTNKFLVNNGVPTGLYTWEFQNTVTDQWLHIQDRAIRWVDGRLVRLEVATDITDLKETEEELRQAKQSAEAANQAKSTFLANMSHELRTPLNAIIGFAQIIARSKSLPPEQQQQLGIINRSGEHLLTLINQVLELSKIEAGRMTLNETVFDLHQLLVELEAMFRLRADDKGVRLVFDRAPNVPRLIRTDEVKLRQVLINLLNNALKFTKVGGVMLWAGVRSQELGVRSRESGSKEDGTGEVIQGTEGLAKGDRSGDRSLSSHHSVPPTGTVRPRRSDEKSSGVDSFQHSRGVGTGDDQRVHPFSEDSQGIVNRGGDADHHFEQTQLFGDREAETDYEPDARSGSDAQRIDHESSEEKLGIRSQALGVRRKKKKSLIPGSRFLTPLTFQVSDTGPGIAPGETEQLFEAFGQTETGRQTHEGTGLGLPISRKFVQLLGGTEIGVESPALKVFDGAGGPGATFSFDIRAEVVTSDDASREPVPAGPTAGFETRAVGLVPGQPLYRLLIVDDEPTNRQLLHDLLSPLGFNLREAENGRQAIDIWQAYQPHLIFMDMRMPVLDGYEATKIIKAGQSDTKIIALTASSFEEEKARILAGGCDDFLHKPFREADLFQLMTRHIGVQFVYETADHAPGSGGTGVSSLTADMLAGLPPEQLSQLAEAIELSDIVRANDIIDDINANDPPLAETLRRLVNNFEYDTVLTTLNQASN